jgi:hypothetical protein
MDTPTFVRRYFLLWAIVATVFFAYINWYVGWDVQKDGTVRINLAGDELKHWWDVTHRVWISVAQTLVLTPLVFIVNWKAIKRFGGFESHIGKAMTFLTAGFVFWGVLGNGVWFGYQISHNGDSPIYPWWPDLFYVMLLPSYLIAMVYLAKSMAVTARDFARQLWIPIGAFLATWYFTVPMPGGHGKKWVVDDWGLWNSEPSTWGPFNWVHASVAYVGMDVVILAVAVIVGLNSRRVSGGLFSAPMRWVAISMLFQYFGDIFYDQRYAAGTYRTGDIATICYGISMYLVMWAIFSFSEVERRLSEELMEVASGDISATNGVTTGGTV